MIDKIRIEDSVRRNIEGTAIFIVAIRLSSTGKITVLVDTMEGITIGECADLHRRLERDLGSDIEDFELQVSSPGLESPFGVMEQYYKNEGRKVAVIDNEGIKYTGILKNVTMGGFDLETEIKLKGKKKETMELSFNFDQVKSVKVALSIK